MRSWHTGRHLVWFKGRAEPQPGRYRYLRPDNAAHCSLFTPIDCKMLAACRWRQITEEEKIKRWPQVWTKPLLQSSAELWGTFWRSHCFASAEQSEKNTNGCCVIVQLELLQALTTATFASQAREDLSDPDAPNHKTRLITPIVLHLGSDLRIVWEYASLFEVILTKESFVIALLRLTFSSTVCFFFRFFMSPIKGLFRRTYAVNKKLKQQMLHHHLHHTKHFHMFFNIATMLLQQLLQIRPKICC